MARKLGRKVKKHCKAPGRMRVRASYEYVDGPEQERAIAVLAQLMADCSRQLATEREPNGGVERTCGKGLEVDMSNYAVYTSKGRAS